MTVLDTVADSLGETVDSIELPALLHEMRIEPRCRICRNDHLRKKVNDMLATGLSYAMILRALQKDNDQTRQARSGHDRLGQKPLRTALPGAERRQGHLPADS